MNPRIVLETGDQPGTQLEIPRTDEAGPVTLGRSSVCTIRLHDPKLSRQHCRLTFDGERLFIEDLNSKNGTQVNGPFIQAVTELHDGDRIEVGSSVLVVRYSVARVAPQDTITAALPAEAAEEEQKAASALEGERLAGYVLGQKLYEGRSCIIYRARDDQQQSIVLKVLRPEACSSEELVARFRRGGKAATRLGHPNLVRMLKTGESAGVPFQAMEYVDGGDLERLLAQHGQPMQVPQAVGIASQILAALQHVHDQGLVMRNVHPGNVLITSKLEAKLTDYDLLKALPGTAEKDITQVTALGPLDDPRFSAPEMITRPVVADQRCDIFGTGACLYFMLTLSAPFPEAQDALSPYRAFRRTVKNPRELNPEILPSVCDVMATAMSDYLDKRYRTPREMLAALEAL